MSTGSKQCAQNHASLVAAQPSHIIQHQHHHSCIRQQMPPSHKLWYTLSGPTCLSWPWQSSCACQGNAYNHPKTPEDARSNSRDTEPQQQQPTTTHAFLSVKPSADSITCWHAECAAACRAQVEGDLCTYTQGRTHILASAPVISHTMQDAHAEQKARA
jgi:hypothetical protein